MKPLRDTEGGSALLRSARALLESEGPLPESRERMLRVRRALDAPQRGGLLRRAPALIAAGAIALFGASAFAAVRYFAVRSAAEERRTGEQARVSRRAQRPAATVAQPEPEAGTAVAAGEPVGRAAREQRAPVEPIKSQARGVHRARPAKARASTPRARAQQAVSRAEPAAIGASAAGAAAQTPTAVPATRASGAVSTTGVAPEAAERGEASAEQEQAEPAARVQPPALPKDSELVHRAVQALRRQGDPALAARLLAKHRARQPSGPLAEEALSLQIEAAQALEDPRALMFAREYLARYPHGRYVRVARQALAGGR